MERTQKFEHYLSEIKPVNQEVFDTCERRFDKIAKPVGSLGKLEHLIERIAAASDSLEVDIRKNVYLYSVRIMVCWHKELLKVPMT